jgi:hypothetical protein
MLAAQVAGQWVVIAGHGQQVQVQRYELRQRRIDGANALHHGADGGMVFTQRAELEYLAEDVDERLVGRRASIGMTTSAELANVRSNDSRTQLVKQTALTNPSLADDQRGLTSAHAGAGESLDEMRQLGLPTGVRSQSSVHGCVDARLQPRFTQDTMRNHRAFIGQQYRGLAGFGMNEGRDQSLTFRRDQDGVAGGQDRQPIGSLYDGATHGVASWSTVHSLRDNQSGAHAGTESNVRGTRAE